MVFCNANSNIELNLKIEKLVKVSKFEGATIVHFLSFWSQCEKRQNLRAKMKKAQEIFFIYFLSNPTEPTVPPPGLRYLHFHFNLLCAYSPTKCAHENIARNIGIN